ncbi:MAG TPA: hypothetical protein VFJ04_02975 [Rhodanobacteraceae bacterium]|jgi:hypothetical protein|nr:hypothetical protein [Rhodanobacteraceae bacterium]
MNSARPFGMRPFGLVAAACVAAMAMACTPSPPAPTPQQAAAAKQAAQEAQAQHKLVMYRKLLQMKNYPLAVSIGDEIVSGYPQTRAAAEVGKTLPGIKASSAAAAEKARLQRLWIYQVGPQSGGIQSTAAIANSTPSNVHVRLILRRHSAWGDSAYLYGGTGFVCKGQCDLPVRFDGARRILKAYLPKGGEPAMFIKDDTGFIAAMRKAKKVNIDVVLKDGGKQTLLFEVAAFDPTRWKKL